MVTAAAFSLKEIDFYKIQYNIYIFVQHRGDVGEAPLIFTLHNALARMINEKRRVVLKYDIVSFK